MRLINKLKSPKRTEPLCDRGHKPVYMQDVMYLGGRVGGDASEKLYRYKCQLCGDITEDTNILNNHILNHIEDDRTASKEGA